MAYMRHWFVQDINGKTIGTLSLNEDVQIPELAVAGERFELCVAYTPGNTTPSYFVIAPDSPVEPKENS